MFKILLALLLMTSPALAVVNQWRGGVGTNELDGTQAANLIGFNSYNHIVQPIDNLLSNYCNEYLQYNSSTIITVIAGTCVVSNSQGTIRLFLQDTSNTNLTSTNLDTGSITASTTYYVYATAATNAATTSTYYISANNTAPSGQTYYYRIGSFTTDSNSQFTYIVNNNWNSYNGTIISKSPNVIYQALTDGFVENTVTTIGNQNNIIEGTASNLSGGISLCGGDVTTAGNNPSCTWPISKGEYWEATNGGIVYWKPSGK